MHAAVMRLELRIRDARSLKQKRGVVKALLAQLMRTFGVSAAEVDHQELWNRATIGVAVVAPQASQLDRILHSVEKHVRERGDAELLGVALRHLENPE